VFFGVKAAKVPLKYWVLYIPLKKLDKFHDFLWKNVKLFSFTKDNELRRPLACLDSKGEEGEVVKLFPCHGNKGNQKWSVLPVSVNYVVTKLL